MRPLRHFLGFDLRIVGAIQRDVSVKREWSECHLTCGRKESIATSPKEGRQRRIEAALMLAWILCPEFQAVPQYVVS
jgi:hypothetical protein